MECAIIISHANKQSHLDLSQGLALFMLIRLYLKSCCLQAPSVAAAFHRFSVDCIKCNHLLLMHALGIHQLTVRVEKVWRCR